MRVAKREECAEKNVAKKKVILALGKGHSHIIFHFESIMIIKKAAIAFYGMKERESESPLRNSLAREQREKSYLRHAFSRLQFFFSLSLRMRVGREHIQWLIKKCPSCASVSHRLIQHATTFLLYGLATVKNRERNLAIETSLTPRARARDVYYLRNSE